MFLFCLEEEYTRALCVFAPTPKEALMALVEVYEYGIIHKHFVRYTIPTEGTVILDDSPDRVDLLKEPTDDPFLLELQQAESLRDWVEKLLDLRYRIS